MITEDYVSFETAKLLKEKGFDEPCTYLWIFEKTNNPEVDDNGIYKCPVKKYTESDYWNNTSIELYKKEDEYWNDNIDFFACPTLQMAMKWLREAHKIHVSVEMGFDVDNRQYFFFAPSICKFSNKTGEYQTPFGEKEFDSYEEACEAAIKYCLENLI